MIYAIMGQLRLSILIFLFKEMIAMSSELLGPERIKQEEKKKECVIPMSIACSRTFTNSQGTLVVAVEIANYRLLQIQAPITHGYRVLFYIITPHWCSFKLLQFRGKMML